MGWLQLGRKSHHHHKPTRFGLQSNDVLKEAAQHVENISLADNHLNLQHDPAGARRYPPVSQSLPNNELPFIPVSEIMKRTSAENGGLCIVVEDIVYDCTDFISEHPGGEKIIQSFAGQECTWQFWRFHGKKDMEELGKPLRVGRTKGLKNRFKEPVRYVGLRRLGDDDW